jgi:hypothetical protein
MIVSSTIPLKEPETTSEEDINTSSSPMNELIPFSVDIRINVRLTMKRLPSYSIKEEKDSDGETVISIELSKLVNVKSFNEIGDFNK